MGDCGIDRDHRRRVLERGSDPGTGDGSARHYNGVARSRDVNRRSAGYGYGRGPASATAPASAPAFVPTMASFNPLPSNRLHGAGRGARRRSAV